MTQKKKEDEAWEEVEGGSFGETIVLGAPGDELEGVYMGSRQVETTDPQGDPRMSTIHDFVGEGDERFCTWGSYDLDGKLTEELKGRRVKITYLKKVPIGKGQELKLFKLLAATG